MRAKATKAQAAQSMLKRAEKMMAGLEGERAGRQGRPDQVPRARRRAARRRSPRRSSRSPTARSRSSPTSTWPSTRAPGWSSSASTAPARPRCCASSPASTSPTPARSCPATGSRSATTPRSTRPSTPAAPCWRTCRPPRPQLTDTEARSVLGLVPLLRRRRPQAGRGALRWREDPAGAGQPGRLQRQRAAARRAHQQPRPRLPRGGAGRDPHLRGRDHPGHPRRGRRPARSSPTGCCCCPTATRTSGTTTTPTWSRWPELAGRRAVGAVPRLRAMTPDDPGRGRPAPRRRRPVATLTLDRPRSATPRRRRCGTPSAAIGARAWPTTCGSWCCAGQGQASPPASTAPARPVGGRGDAEIGRRTARRSDDEVVGDDRRLPAGLHLAARPAVRLRRRRARATRSAPASSWPCPATCAWWPTTRVLHEGGGPGPGPGPHGNKAAGRAGWLRPGAGDLRHGPDGRRPPRRSPSGWRSTVVARRRTSTPRLDDLVASLTAPLPGAVARDQGAAAGRADATSTSSACSSGRPRPGASASWRRCSADAPAMEERLSGCTGRLAQHLRSDRSDGQGAGESRDGAPGLRLRAPAPAADLGVPGRHRDRRLAGGGHPAAGPADRSTTASSTGDRALVTWLALAWPATALVGAVLTVIGGLLSSRIGEGLIFDLRTQVFAHVQRQSLAFFTRTQTGALVSRLNNDVIGAQRAFTSHPVGARSPTRSRWSSSASPCWR